MKMNRITLAVLPLIFSAATAFAQSPQSSIRESTDPARVAEVERRAQELRSGPAQMGAGGQPRMQGTMAEGHEHMRGGRHHEGRRHHGGKHHGHHRHHRMHDSHPKGAPDARK